MSLHNLLTLLRTPHLKTLVQLRSDLHAFLRFNFLYAAFESGLLHALRMPASKADLESRLGIQRPELFESLLDMGVALGELGNGNGVYWLKGQRAQVIAASDGDPYAAYLQESVMLYGSLYRHLPERLKGAPLDDYLASAGDLVARSSRIVEPLVADFVKRVVSTHAPLRMLEIGCGSGIYVRHAAEANPQLTGLAMDMLPEVAEQARQNLAGWGLRERFQTIVGDIRQPPAGVVGPFDLITLYNNIYYFTREERTRLFQMLRTQLQDGGGLALVSILRGNDIDSVNFDLILRSTQGCAPLPTLDQLVEQLRANGFRKIKSEQLAPGESFYGVLAYA